mmetsp:Transcript_30320/g.47057  ORF Transcript_30320/g.47057 Transcript_30320/m.47057 type:complete len:161 (-) Transcript_30320:976-1458(-)
MERLRERVGTVHGREQGVEVTNKQLRRAYDCFLVQSKKAKKSKIGPIVLTYIRTITTALLPPSFSTPSSPPSITLPHLPHLLPPLQGTIGSSTSPPSSPRSSSPLSSSLSSFSFSSLSVFSWSPCFPSPSTFSFFSFFFFFFFSFLLGIGFFSSVSVTAR